MPGNAANGQVTLPCGQSADDLLAQVADGAPPIDHQHQRNCPHCRETLAELETLWQPVWGMAAEEIRAPADLLANVRNRVRDLLEHGWFAVIATTRGDTRIAARVLGALARLAAEEVPGVSVALSGPRTRDTVTASEPVSRTGDAATTVGVAGTYIVIDVDVVVQMGSPIPHLSRKVHQRIAQRIAALTGLTTHEVNVTVVDVVPSTDMQ